jgi:hypothetical protein
MPWTALLLGYGHVCNLLLIATTKMVRCHMSDHVLWHCVLEDWRVRVLLPALRKQEAWGKLPVRQGATGGSMTKGWQLLRSRGPQANSHKEITSANSPKELRSRFLVSRMCPADTSVGTWEVTEERTQLSQSQTSDALKTLDTNKGHFTSVSQWWCYRATDKGEREREKERERETGGWRP